MKKSIQSRIAKIDVRTVSEEELRTIEGGVVARVDEDGNVIADCTHYLYRTKSGAEWWLPHGTIVFEGI